MKVRNGDSFKAAKVSSSLAAWTKDLSNILLLILFRDSKKPHSLTPKHPIASGTERYLYYMYQKDVEKLR